MSNYYDERGKPRLHRVEPEPRPLPKPTAVTIRGTGGDSTTIAVALQGGPTNNTGPWVHLNIVNRETGAQIGTWITRVNWQEFVKQVAILLDTGEVGEARQATRDALRERKGEL